MGPRQRVVPVHGAQSAEIFSFINVSDPSQSRHKDIRKLVRSNAMRDFREKKRRVASERAQSNNRTLAAEPHSPLLQSIEGYNDPPSHRQHNVPGPNILQQALGSLPEREEAEDDSYDYSQFDRNHPGFDGDGLELFPMNNQLMICKNPGASLSDPFQSYPGTTRPSCRQYEMNQCKLFPHRQTSLSGTSLSMGLSDLTPQ